MKHTLIPLPSPLVPEESPCTNILNGPGLARFPSLRGSLYSTVMLSDRAEQPRQGRKRENCLSATQEPLREVAMEKRELLKCLEVHGATRRYGKARGNTEANGFKCSHKPEASRQEIISNY